jgi:hypothetical protein
MLEYLQKQSAAQTDYHAVIKEEIKTLKEQAKNSLDSIKDVAAIEKVT